MADLLGKVNCTYCQEEITGIRVQCCECVDFDICTQCFAYGAEIGPHRNDHSYRFVNAEPQKISADSTSESAVQDITGESKEHGTVSIFGGRGGWTGREELQLLDAMELYGFGSWEYVSKHINSRSAEEVREEYTAKYLDGTIGKVTWNEIGDCRPNLPEHTPQDKGPLAPEVTSRLPPLVATPEEARQLGYMPQRDDFEREYDIQSDQLVSSLQLSGKDDNEMEIALKLAQVDMYTRRLRERYRRKRIVRDYQLVSKFYEEQRKAEGQILPRPVSQDQKDFRDEMRVFSQFLTSGEHERLIDSIERERELRHRISELVRYRGLGLSSQEEILHYEQHVAYQQQQEQLTQSKAGSSGYGTTTQEHLSENGSGEGGSHQGFTDERSTLLPDDEHNSNSSLANIQPPPITSLPQGAFLSQHEIQLCTSLNLEPMQYRSLKSVIIQDNLLSSGMNRSLGDSCANGSEVSVKDVVTRYLSVSGWLPNVSVV